MPAKIYKPTKTAMQSGKGQTHQWRLEFEQEVPRSVEPLMGYTSSTDMKQQLRLTFPTKEAAIDYAERNGIAYTVFEPQEPKRRTIAYADNFRYNRIGQWTH
jgi:NADH dehydrogenase ubiquinone Fe-S protein 4